LTEREGSGREVQFTVREKKKTRGWGGRGGSPRESGGDVREKKKSRKRHPSLNGWVEKMSPEVGKEHELGAGKGGAFRIGLQSPI